MARTFFGRKQKKACVIGLDGVPYSLLRSLVDSGVMPRTGEIVSRGRIEPMTVTLPEISSVSWSTFMTGRNPGEHGIFGFTDLKEDGYGIRFPAFGDLKSPTIWDRLGEHGMRSVVVNQPSTYPARPIPGILVSGFVAIDLARSVAPAEYVSELEGIGYRIDIDTERCRDDPDELFSQLLALLDARRAAADLLWESEDWHLMEIVVTGTDRLHHFMWDAWKAENHPHHEDFLAYYRRVDDLIHHIYERSVKSGVENRFFLLSDHGFCGVKKEVQINAVLRKAGFLDLPEGATSLEGITETTKAFALDPARIYLNRTGRFPNGSVEDGDAESLLGNLVAVFERLEHKGEHVIRRIFTRDEAYSGPFAERGPDLLLVPRNGYDLKGRPGAGEMLGERRFQGMHTWDDAFFFSLDASALRPGNGLNIIDVPGKITGSLGVDI
jgi:predicted AlkP superfamily phosphohydrolase/phosphomutase